MEKNYGRIRQIAEQLPIGLYAKRRIETDLSEGETGSYYAPMEDKIVISFPQIAQGLTKIDENDPYMETAIRSMVYHEVSHALLTPKDLQPTDIINIFEDELKLFYLIITTIQISRRMYFTLMIMMDLLLRMLLMNFIK